MNRRTKRSNPKPSLRRREAERTPRNESQASLGMLLAPPSSPVMDTETHVRSSSRLKKRKELSNRDDADTAKKGKISKRGKKENGKENDGKKEEKKKKKETERDEEDEEDEEDEQGEEDEEDEQDEDKEEYDEKEEGDKEEEDKEEEDKEEGDDIDDDDKDFEEEILDEATGSISSDESEEYLQVNKNKRITKKSFTAKPKGTAAARKTSFTSTKRAVAKNKSVKKKKSSPKKKVVRRKNIRKEYVEILDEESDVGRENSTNTEEVVGSSVQTSQNERVFLHVNGTLGRLQPFQKTHLDKETAGFLADACVDLLASLILRPSEIVQTRSIMPLPNYSWVDNSEHEVSHIFNTTRFVFELKRSQSAEYWSNVLENDIVFIPILFDSHWSLLAVKGTKTITKFLMGSWEPGKDKIQIMHLDSTSGNHHSRQQVKKILWWFANGLCTLSQKVETINVDSNRAISWIESVTEFEVSPNLRGQQKEGSVNCGWWVPLNARYFLLKECGQDVSIPTENDIEEERKLYLNTVDKLPKTSLTNLERAPGNEFKYKIPDLLRCTRKYLDEALLLVADYTTPGGDRKKAEETSKRRKEHAMNRMKGLKFKFHNISTSTTRKERLALADICEYFPPGELSNPIFNAMDQYVSSGILHNGVKTVFSNEGELKNKEDSTVKSQLAHIFKLADCSSTNKQADTVVFTIGARAHLHTIFVHFIAIAEACFLAKHVSSSFSVQNATEWNYLDPQDNCVYPVTSDDIHSNSNDDDEVGFTLKEKNRIISKLFVASLRLLHTSMKTGLRLLRHNKRISPGSVMKGAQQLTENDFGIPMELVKMFLTDLFKECVRGTGEDQDTMKVLVSKLITNFLQKMNFKGCSTDRELASENAKQIMDLYWKMPDTSNIQVKKRITSKNTREVQDDTDHSLQGTEVERSVGELESNIPFERWIGPAVSCEANLVFTGIILHFIQGMIQKGQIHARRGPRCIKGQCNAEAINELKRFSSASQRMNEKGINPFYNGMKDGDSHMQRELNWICFDTISDLLQQTDIVCSTANANGLTVSLEAHSEKREITWHCTVLEINEVRQVTPDKYSGWISADGENWGIGGICFDNIGYGLIILCQCTLVFEMPKNPNGTFFKEIDGETVEVRNNQLIHLHLPNHDFLGMTVSCCSMSNTLGPNQLYKVSVLLVCEEGDVNVLSRDESDLGECIFFPVKNVSYEEEFLIFQGLSTMHTLPPTFLKALYDPKAFLREDSFFQEWKLHLLIRSGNVPLFQEMNQISSQGYLRYQSDANYKKRLIESVDRSIEEYGAKVNYPLFEAQKVAVRGWMYNLLFENYFKEARQLRPAADLMDKRVHSLLTGNVSFIHGPPGTGKSAVTKYVMDVSKLLFNRRTLVLSTTNEAVDNVLTKYDPKLKQNQRYKANGKIIRLGSGSSDKNIKLLELANLREKMSVSRNYQMRNVNFETLLNNASVVAGTFGSLIRLDWKNVDHFHQIIVDEAAHARESLVVGTLSRIMTPNYNSYQTTDLIFMGDHNQLKPYLHDSRSTNLDKPPDCGLFFYRIMREMKENSFMLPSATLDTQYRMSETIMKLLKKLFYPFLKQGERSSSRDWVNNSFDKVVSKIPHLSNTIVSVDLSSLFFVRSSNLGSSFKNEYEATVVKHILLQLNQASAQLPARAAVLTPYRGQVPTLRRKIDQNPALKNVYCGTFDSSQGQEYDIVILSLVRTGNAPRLSFLNNPNSICMTLSRAREHLYIVGSLKDICSGSEEWRRVFYTLNETSTNDDDFSYTSIKTLKIESGSVSYARSSIDFNT